MGKRSSAARQRRKARRSAVPPPSHPAWSSEPPPVASSLLLAFWYTAGALTFWSFGYTPMRGSDLWWHVAAGRWMWEQKSLPLTDPWSFTRAGQPWVHHEWLSDVIYHAWASLFGLPALVFWKWAVMLAAYGLLMRTLHRLTRDPLAAYLAAVAALAVGAPFLDVRPHLYSLLGFAIVLHLTLGRTEPSRWLPLVFLGWVNLHGGFFFGLLALGLVLSSSAVVQRLEPGPAPVGGGPLALRPSDKRLALLAAASVLVCLINPNGLEAFTYPLKYAFDTTSPFLELAEWLPPFQEGGIHSPLYGPAIAAFALAALIVMVSGVRRDDRLLGLAGLALGGLTLAMSLRSRRFIPIFGMSESLILALALRRVTTPLLRLLGSRWWRLAPPLVAFVCAVVWLAPYPKSSAALLALTAEDSFPVETCNFIEANQISGRIFAYYNWGGYVHLCTKGRLQVYIDGRADTVFDAGTYNRYLQVLNLRDGWRDIVEASGATYVLWPKNRSAQPQDLLRSGRWRLLYEDVVSMLLIRADWPPPSPLRETPDSPWRRLVQADHAARTGQLPQAEAHLQRALEQMPHLSLACHSLARIQALQDRIVEAVKTEDHCQAIFPSPGQLKSFRDLLRQAKPRPPGRGQ